MTHELETRFKGTGEVMGMEFIQLQKTPNYYLYEVKNNKSTHYELFERRKSPVCIDFSKRLYSETEFKETYPKARNFGDWAWSFYKLDDANKFRQRLALEKMMKIQQQENMY